MTIINNMFLIYIYIMYTVYPHLSYNYHIHYGSHHHLKDMIVTVMVMIVMINRAELLREVHKAVQQKGQALEFAPDFWNDQMLAFRP